MKTKEIRLSDLLARTVEEGECLIWQGQHYNYVPKIQKNGKTLNVRREIYKQVYGELPDRLQVGVKCKTLLCTAPDCLIARSRSTAMKQANYTQAGRAANVKTARVRAKINIEIAREIRASTETGQAVDKRMGLYPGCAARIRKGGAWVDHASPFAGLGAR